MKRLLYLSYVLLLLLSTILTAGADFTPALDKNTEAEIVVAGSYNNFEALEAAFDGFQSFYPNVKMSYVKLDEYNKTIKIVISGEEAPDIYCMQQWMIGREDYAFLFDNAVDLADPDLNIDLDVIRPGLLYTDPDGKVPMLPIFSTTYGFLINENIFEKEGLSIPATYTELINVTEQLKEAGYPGPILGFNSASQMFYSLTYPDFSARVMDDPDAAAKLNALDPEAAEYMRPTLTFVKDMVDRGMIDLELCSRIEDDYQATILRFFEGDVPMMIMSGDTVSGTSKRESLSENFTKFPFKYSFHAIPSTDNGLYFLNLLNLAFAANKNSSEPEMRNEFMRYLATTETLNNMARIKRLITTSRDLSLDGVYASFGDFDEAHTINFRSFSLLDAPMIQIRSAAYAVANGEMTIDEAIAAFGTF